MTLARSVRALRDAVHLLVGMPSYDTYRAHMAQAHPGQPVMSEAAFFRDRQQARYGGRNGGRCC